MQVKKNKGKGKGKGKEVARYKLMEEPAFERNTKVLRGNVESVMVEVFSSMLFPTSEAGRFAKFLQNGEGKAGTRRIMGGIQLVLDRVAACN